MSVLWSEIFALIERLNQLSKQLDERERQLDRQIRQPDNWNGNPLGE